MYFVSLSLHGSSWFKSLIQEKQQLFIKNNKDGISQYESIFSAHVYSFSSVSPSDDLDAALKLLFYSVCANTCINNIKSIPYTTTHEKCKITKERKENPLKTRLQKEDGQTSENFNWCTLVTNWKRNQVGWKKTEYGL